MGAEKDGETYEGWFCTGCSYFIKIDKSWPEAVRIPDAHHVKAVCPNPQCKTEHRGTWGARKTIVHVTPAHAPSVGGTHR